MNDSTAGYSTFSSAWFALVYGNGDIHDRLTNALVRAIAIADAELSDKQLSVFEGLGASRLREISARQMKELVESLDEKKVHHLAETIALLYLMTVRPFET